MFRRYRQRRGPYALAAPSVLPAIALRIALVAVALLLLFFVGRWIIHLFGGGNETVRSPVALSIEKHSTVSVSLEGGLTQRAEDDLKLYANDTVGTGTNGHALLTFFDGSRVRLDEQTDMTVTDSMHGTEESSFAVTLKRGSVWVRVPTSDAFSGAIIRTLTTPRFICTLAADTEAVINANTIVVFRADGNGVQLDVKGAKGPLMLGEGQQLTLPASVDSKSNLEKYRSAIDPLAAAKPFVLESRIAAAPRATEQSFPQLQNNAIMTITAPAEGATINASTVIVKGTVGSKVDRVRVNGYQANIDTNQGTFSEEISLTNGATMDIQVEALDANDIVLSELTRTINHTKLTVTPPAITKPAGNGQTYRTQRTEIEIRGTATSKTNAVMVNDYKLQLFRSGDTTWSYLASTALDNLHTGKNVFDVVSIDEAGSRSDAAHLTILLEEGVEGLVSTGSTIPTAVDEASLPKNPPLTPGTLAVTGPTPGSQHTATGSEFVLEGTTSGTTDSVWVNGYKLQLYRPGKTTWNYIASVAFKTLKIGTNTYRITARNGKGEILDTMEYTVTYKP